MKSTLSHDIRRYTTVVKKLSDTEVIATPNLSNPSLASDNKLAGDDDVNLFQDQMSPEQKLAFEKYKSGQNVFITGPGGTGKSAIIREIYKYATQREHNIQVCALTGCAAVMLDCKAKTIHSWAGIGLANGDIDTIVHRVDKNFFKKKDWRKTRTLIVDEVSMMSKRLFDILDIVGKTVRNNHSRPFGGIQLIFCGDFYQLPPVGINTEDPDNSRFCFESENWFHTFPKENHIQLKQPMKSFGHASVCCCPRYLKMEHLRPNRRFCTRLGHVWMRSIDLKWISWIYWIQIARRITMN